MKHIMMVLAFAGFVWAAGGSAADEQAVRSALQQFNTAAHAGDEAKLNALVSSDLIYVHSSGKVETKAECVAALVKTKPEFEVAPGLKVNVYGNTALVHGKMIANTTQNGAPAKLQLDFMQVWVKNGKNWQMVARHTARITT